MTFATNIARTCALLAGLAYAALGLAQQAAPERLRLVGQETEFVAETAQGKVVITRVLTPCAKVKGWLQPLVPVPGVVPITEVELLGFYKDPEAMLVDMREPEWFVKATIPGAVNIPYTEVASRLGELGCAKTGKGWDCAKARKVVAFCNGPMCPQSPTAITAMVREGFPAGRIYYYRGGMFDWEGLGLTTVEGDL
jgi:rhodanese-related sulfurtransferase